MAKFGAAHLNIISFAKRDEVNYVPMKNRTLFEKPYNNTMRSGNNKGALRDCSQITSSYVGLVILALPPYPTSRYRAGFLDTVYDLSHSGDPSHEQHDPIFGQLL